jgi:hypothetical protein
MMRYEKDNLRIIESMPMPVCKFGRAHFSKSFKGIVSVVK